MSRVHSSQSSFNLWMLVAAAAAVGGAGVRAADSVAADDLTEIVVTAQFREERVQDTPLAITAVPAELLEQRGQSSIVDVGAFVPSVNLSNATAINANAIAAFIRGIGQEDSNFALEPGVGIYVDDVYLGTTYGSVLELADLERVEVLRGPQGTLAGKNSLGGAIKLYSRKPDAAGGGYVEAGYGNYDNLLLRAAGGFTLAEGVYARLSGSYRKSDGFFKQLDYGCVNPAGGIAPTGNADGDCVLSRAGGRDVLALRGALRYAPDGSPLEVNLVADLSRDDSGSPPVVTSFANLPLVRSYVAADPFAGVPFDSRFITPPGSYTSYANYGDSGNYSTVFGGFPAQVAPGVFSDPEKNSADGYGVAATIDYHFSDTLNLKSITAYRHVDGVSVIDIDGSPLDILKERLGQEHSQFTQELRLSGEAGSRALYTLGAYYYDADDRMKFRIQIPIFLYDFLSNDPVSNRSVATFGHLEFKATDQLTLIAGLRYTWDEKTYTFGRSNADGSAISGIPLTMNFLVYGLDGLVGRFKDQRADWRLGIKYDWTDHAMTYLQVSTGYKGGGVNPRPFVPDQVLDFAPEELITYEAGVKLETARRSASLGAAVFYNDYKDIQRTLYVCANSVSPTCSLPANAGDARSMGVELESSLRPTDELAFYATVSYLDFEYRSINPATGITLDMVAPFSSRWQGSAGVQYDFGLGERGTLTPRVDWSFLSSYYYNSVNAPLNRIGGRGLVNARLSYVPADSSWEIAAAATNLLDKYYNVGAMENVANFGLSTYVPGRPREFQLSVRKSF
ncbi:MAG: TonB-dependent receptor [Gammaproteobacteria bacterium]|nr:TonB-dependent receptor [Gammaproteobacteria bacterium]